MMAFLHFDRNYAPCSVLIVRDGGDPYKDADTVLVQGDDDMKAIAETIGWHEGIESGLDWHEYLEWNVGPTPVRGLAEILDEYLPETVERYYVPSDAEARAIAADWHGGQYSAMYAFVSTGTILAGFRGEIQTELENPRIGDAPTASLQQLLNYVEWAAAQDPCE